MAISQVIMGITAVAAFLGIHTSLSGEDKYWYDIYHYYHEFNPQDTDKIDAILSNPQYGKMGRTIVKSPGNHIPGEGVHYYHAVDGLCLFHRVGLVKLKNKDTKKFYYLAWRSPTNWGERAFQSLENRLRAGEQNTIQVITIDTSEMDPIPLLLTKDCQPHRPHQKLVVEEILRRFSQPNHYNVKILISGLMGSGKTYIGMLVKRSLQNILPQSDIMLFDDFDPSAIGVNINKLALKYASRQTPVIIVMNEVNKIYEEVVAEKQNYDPRTQHTRNKQSFNNMMDTISSIPYVITICTSELSHEDLYETEEYRSFMRPGRIDFFVKMTNETSTIHNN